MKVENSEALLGRQLQRARQAAGLTQQELCQRANLSYSTLAKIERGAIKSPSVFTIQNIAVALGTTLDTLLLGLSPPLTGRTAKQCSKSGIRFVYFDINGCLVRFFHRAFIRLSEQTGEPADAVESTFWHFNDAVCRGDMTMAEFNHALAKRLGQGSIDWAEYYLDAVDPIVDMQELVLWVSEHYYAGLLSNIMPGLIDDLKDRKLLPDVCFDQVIDSSQVGAIKPEQAIYKIAEQRSGFKPDEILLIDDSRANLMAAEHMGWHVLWFDDYRTDDSIQRIRQALDPEM